MDKKMNEINETIINKNDTTFSDFAKTVDEILGDDSQLIEKLAEAQGDLVKLFKDEDITEQLVKIIENSEIVSFFSERSRKSLDFSKPVFRIKINFGKAVEIYNNKINIDALEKEKMISFFIKVIQKEVINKFSELIFYSLKEHWKKHKKEEDIKEYENDDLLLLISSIFGIAVEDDDKPPSAKLCTLRFVI
jgi:hypothetical protein